MDYEFLKDLDQKHHFHPFTHHSEMHIQGTHVITSAEGVYATDIHGRTLLDGLAGLWCVNVGHGRKEIIDAVHQQMSRVAFYPSFLNTTTEPAILLAERLIRLAPKRLNHVFFSNSGSEANETALKLIRAIHQLKGATAKKKILTLNFGYHGVSLATTSMTQLPSCQAPFDLPLSGFIKIPSPYHFGADTTLSPIEYGQRCLQETKKIILKEDPQTIAALFAEPVQGAGGVIVHPEGYLVGLRKLCREFSILYVSDEVITGFGRLGSWFGSHIWDLDPDLLTTAKGITSGYLPLGATLISREISESLIQGGYLAHGFTYSGHPTSCAAALANIDVLEKEDLIERTRLITGPYFQNQLNQLLGHPAVGEVRGYGLIGAIELLPRGGKNHRSAKMPLGPQAMKLAREEGVIVRGIRDLIAIAPPLVIEKSQIDQLFKGIVRMLNRLWS